jgi:hypothetical protein
VGSGPRRGGGQEPERAYRLWKARQVAEAAGSYAAPVVEAKTRGETKRRRVEAVPEDLRERAAGEGGGLPGVEVKVPEKWGKVWKDRGEVLEHAVFQLKPGVFEELVDTVGWWG